MRFPAVALTGLILASGPMSAQTPPTPHTGSVRIVVHDPAALPILGAEVTLVALPRPGERELTDSDSTTVKVTTDNRGEANFVDIRPGRYSGRVTSPGFSPFDLTEFSIHAGGRVTREVTLQVAGLVEQVNVSQTTDDDRLLNSFTRQLTPDQIEALPEDPEELAVVLRQLLGEDADVRVDGFKGGRLPLGTQIQDIRIRDDVGAASSGGGPRVDITTSRGGERWRNNPALTVRDDSLSARNSFSNVRPTGQALQYSWNLSGPIIRDRTGLSVSIDGSDSTDIRTTRGAALGGAIYSQSIEQPSKAIGLWTRLEHQITPAQILRVEAGGRVSDKHNQGIGDFDLPERAFTSNVSSGELRVGHHATLRRGYVNDFQFAFEWESSDTIPLTGARTIRVLDAFTSGGAEEKGGQRTRNVAIENELEFTLRKKHRITAGASLDGSDYRGDETSNAAGTYTFSSLAAFEAGRPTTFTQRVGEPTFGYSFYRFGWFLQDDFRVRRNTIINLGLRQDVQTYLRDWTNVSPRLGVSWTPSSRARTTLRASAGVVRSQLDEATYRQLRLVDGLVQRDLVISDPGYPDPFTAGVTQAAVPPSIIRARDDLGTPVNQRYSVGADQPIGPFFRFRATFSRQTGDHLFRSRNANAPVNGVRPDPSVGNVTELENTARSLNQSIQTEVSISYPPRRFSTLVSYGFGKAMNDTDGVFSLPPDNSDLTGEWGPSRADVRHRVNVSLNTDLIGGLRVATNFRGQSASPYNITTGTDLNGDGIYNERPPGVSRNSARGGPTTNLDFTLTWRLSLGQYRSQDAPRDRTQRLPARRDNDLFRFEVYARATNVLNRVNPQNFSGVVTSPLFGLPTSASASRRIVLGTRIWF